MRTLGCMLHGPPSKSHPIDPTKLRSGRPRTRRSNPAQRRRHRSPQSGSELVNRPRSHRKRNRHSDVGRYVPLSEVDGMEGVTSLMNEATATWVCMLHSNRGTSNEWVPGMDRTVFLSSRGSECVGGSPTALLQYTPTCWLGPAPPGV